MYVHVTHPCKGVPMRMQNFQAEPFPAPAPAVGLPLLPLNNAQGATPAPAPAGTAGLVQMALAGPVAPPKGSIPIMVLQTPPAGGGTATVNFTIVENGGRTFLQVH
jgi:hypothetical protein